MFTGIIEKTGRLQSMIQKKAELWELVINYGGGWNDLKLGESIAVDGACLTLTNFSYDTLSMELSPETIRKTVLNERPTGAKLNLERALQLGDRVGGHLLQGHVEGFADVVSIVNQEGCREITFSFEPRNRAYMIEKGSVGLSGVSLTICNLKEASFNVALIPTTLKMTNLGELSVDDRVHLETDMIGKYVESVSQYGSKPN